MKKYEASITFELKNNHPYYDVENAGPFTFSDTYFDQWDRERDYMIEYISDDLKLVAGGGYRTDTIKNVKIMIK